ncbi:MAG: hypothetical protein MUE73_21820, partial [Planctomycetes bacterium]|nr:hypothetical protein [Planctomycetota bacterium]
RVEGAVALVRTGGDRAGPIGVVLDALFVPDAIDREYAARALLRLGAAPVADWLAALLARGAGRVTAATGAISGAPEDERAFLPAELSRLCGSRDARLAAGARSALDVLLQAR